MPKPQDEQAHEEARRLIAYLSTRPDPDFEDAVMAYVSAPQPGETEVFRSAELAQRSARVVGLLKREANRKIESAALALKRNPRDVAAAQESDQQKQLRNLLGFEEAALRHIADTERIRRGEDPTAPNANSRALRKLRALYPQDFLRLKREAEAEIAEERAVEKKRRRAARLAEQGGTQGPERR